MANVQVGYEVTVSRNCTDKGDGSRDGNKCWWWKRETAVNCVGKAVTEMHYQRAIDCAFQFTLDLTLEQWDKLISSYLFMASTCSKTITKFGRESCGLPWSWIHKGSRDGWSDCSRGRSIINLVRMPCLPICVCRYSRTIRTDRFLDSVLWNGFPHKYRSVLGFALVPIMWHVTW